MAQPLKKKTYRKYDVPLATLARYMGVSRQRVWQLVQKAEGKCVLCATVCNLFSAYCDGCAVKHRRHSRRQNGSKPWKAGKSGRRPLDA